MQIIDTRGQLCPAPLITTKRAIKSAAQGGSFTVITDNDTACSNLLRFLQEMGFQTTCVTREDGQYISFSTNGAIPTQMPEVAEVCETVKTSDYIVAIKGENMGEGSDELGAILMRACINSLSELDALPRAVIMYNGGVNLAVKGKDTTESLEKLATMGVSIIVCGACVDYFGIKPELTPVAQISNMYTINSMLSKASHVIYP